MVAGAAPQGAWDAALGGLSGLYYEAASGLLYAPSDDARRWPPRLYVFGVQLSASDLQIVPRAVLTLASSVESLGDLDAESLAGDGRGALFLGTEGHHERVAKPTPGVLRLDREGNVLGRLPLPPELWSDDGSVGGRSNLGFEGLTVSPSGRFLTAVHESALVQDGPVANFEHGTTVRLLRWELQTSRPPEQLTYRTEPVVRGPAGASVWHNGVSALLALDDERLLVLERAYVGSGREAGRNTVRLFEVHVDDAGGGSRPRALGKRLVLDLDDVLTSLEPGLQRLDNFEGLALGPQLPGGQRSVLLVSDDNFNERQRTVFLALRLLE